MASSSAYLPDYTSLWAEPLEPNFPRPPSPPRRGTISSHDARRAAHEQALRNVARARSVYHHSTGHHLPDRGSPLCQDPTLGFHLGLGLSWRDQVKLQEAEAGYTWNGSSVTEQEEHELSEEEEIRMTWRENVLSYGRSSLLVLGRGRTMQEEAQEREDREALAANGGASAANTTAYGGWTGQGNASVANINGNGVALAAGVHEGGSDAERREQGAVERSQLMAGDRGGVITQMAEGGRSLPGPVAARIGSRRGEAAEDVRLRAEDRDVYEGEYTLDDGDAEEDEDDDGRATGTRGAGRREVDLDAGMESMD